MIVAALTVPGRARADGAPKALDAHAEPEDSSATVSPLRGPEEDDASAEAPTSDERRVRVHITSARPVTLQRRPAGTTAWLAACTDPCERDLPLGDDYRVTGAGLRSSNELKLEAAPNGGVDLRVDAATSGAWQLGVIVGGAGILVDTGALYLLVVSFVINEGECASPSALVSVVAQGVCRDKPSPATLRTLALVALVPGTIAAIAGIASATSNWSTGVRQTAEAAPPVVLRTAEYGGPTFSTPDPTPALLFPLYAGRF